MKRMSIIDLCLYRGDKVFTCRKGKRLLVETETIKWPKDRHSTKQQYFNAPVEATLWLND